MTESTITLYELPGCYYCQMVRTKLEELGLDYEVVDVPGPHSQRTEVRGVSGQTSVPVIVDEAHGIDGLNESSDIVAYLERTYGKTAQVEN